MKDEQLERSLDMAESQAKLALGFLDQAIKRIEWLRKQNKNESGEELTALTDFERKYHVKLINGFVVGFDAKPEDENSSLFKVWERNNRSNPDYWDFVKKTKQKCTNCEHPENFKVGEGCADCWNPTAHKKREQ